MTRSRWARVNRRDLVDPIVVESRHGGGGLGPALEAPVTVRGRVRRERKLVRRDDGEVAEATLTIRVAPELVDDEGAAHEAAGLFTLGSRVTAAGVAGYVLAVTVAGARGVVEFLALDVGGR